MNNFKNNFRKIITATALMTTMYCSPLTAQIIKSDSIESNRSKIELKLDAKVDAALKSTNQSLDSRTEVYVSSSAKIDELTFKYDGLHLMENFNSQTYFGSNTLTMTKNGAGTGICSVITTTKKGIVDVQYGLLNKTISKKVGADFGYVRMTANKDKANVTFLIGKNLGHGYSGYAWCNTTKPYDAKIKNITWLELNKKFTDHVSSYVRAEVTNAKLGEGAILLGVYLKK